MCFQPRAQSAAPTTGSMGSCDYWCKGKSVLHELMLVFFPGQREKSDVCMGCQAEALHTAAVPLAVGEGAGSSPAVGRRSCLVLVASSWNTLPLHCPILMNPPVLYLPFFLHCTKQQCKCHASLKEYLTVLFQSPRALLRDVAQPVLSGCTCRALCSPSRAESGVCMLDHQC